MLGTPLPGTFGDSQSRKVAQVADITSRVHTLALVCSGGRGGVAIPTVAKKKLVA